MLRALTDKRPVEPVEFDQARSARARAYSTSHVGKGLVSSGQDDAGNNTILAFDFPDNMPHGCVLPDELLLASCL